MTGTSFLDSASSDSVLHSQDGPVAIITLNRVEAMNTITNELEARLHEALDAAQDDDSVRAIVLTGAGERAFSAGYDLDETNNSENASERLRFWWRTDRASPAKHWHLLSLEKPVIAAVRGWCLAGAFWYALASDITIAGEDAVFGQPEIRETQNSTALFPFLVGWKIAARYALTGDHFDAYEALRIGVVNEVVAADAVLPRAIELGKRIAMVPADSVRMNKMIITQTLSASGLRNAMEGQVPLSAIVHSLANDSPELRDVLRIRQESGMAASLKERDGKFIPEPGGPRSKR